MQWLQQNWLLVVLGVGALWMFTRHGGGMGCGMGGGHASHGHGPESPSDMQESASAQAVDPVTGRPVDPATAVSTVYHGVPVYFESRENRDRFEAAPGDFPITPAMSRLHRHGGC
ncbi:MAG: hypothetical protein M0T84_18525 [Betaproteobacteria bacterium]|nr:hypothetical protein [Betaproteobacteria bacterium]